MSRMYNPPHPGEVLKDGVMVEGTTVTSLAEQLGVTRAALSRILNAHAGISADMAIKLARVFGGSAESWLYTQANYDLWQAEHRAVQRSLQNPVKSPAITKRKKLRPTAKTNSSLNQSLRN